jgi:ketosteroid isomerase-like protein
VRTCGAGLIIVFVTLAITSAQDHTDAALRTEIDALNAAMVTAFKRDPAAVAAFYTDDAAIIGGGQRHQGRAAVDAYWKNASMFKEWTLETIETGGPRDVPWQYGRSVIVGQSGRRMETYFLGLLQRQPSGELKFRADVFTRERSTAGAEEATRVADAWLKAVETGDADTLQTIFDDQFVILSSGGARNKAGEIADLVPKAGVRLPYFRSDDTRTRAFGALAITTGILRWELNGRQAERNYASISANRGPGWKILAQQVSRR